MGGVQCPNLQIGDNIETISQAKAWGTLTFFWNMRDMEMMQNQKQHSDDYSNKWIYFGVSALAAFMGTLDSSIVNVALPTLSEEFNADVDVVSWVALAYILTMTALLLVAGKLLDIWGERKQFVIGFTMFTIGSALCAFSVSIYMLIFSRAFQALGGAVLMSSNQGLIAKGFPPHQRGRVLGTVGTVVSVGLASGPVLGGFLIEHLGWRSIFWINLPIGVIAVVYCLRTLENNPSATREYKFDWRGSILMIIGLAAFFLGVNLWTDYGWQSPVVFGPVLGSLGMLGIFVFNELRVPNPILNLTLLRIRYFSLSSLCAFIAFVGLMSNTILMPFYIQQVRGFSPQILGLFMMTVPLSMLLIAPFAGWLSDKIGTRIPATIGLTILGSGLYMLSMLDQTSSHFEIVWHLFLVGFGMGVFASPNTNAILSAVPRSYVGVASGFNALMRTSGITFGIAISVILFTFFRDIYTEGKALSEAAQFMAGIHPAFKVAGFIIVIAIILSASRGKRPNHE